MKMGIVGLRCDACLLDEPVESGRIRMETLYRVEWACPRCEAEVRQFVPPEMWHQLVDDLQMPYGTAISNREVKQFSRSIRMFDERAVLELFSE